MIHSPLEKGLRSLKNKVFNAPNTLQYCTSSPAFSPINLLSSFEVSIHRRRKLGRRSAPAQASHTATIHARHFPVPRELTKWVLRSSTSLLFAGPKEYYLLLSGKCPSGVFSPASLGAKEVLKHGFWDAAA